METITKTQTPNVEPLKRHPKFDGDPFKEYRKLWYDWKSNTFLKDKYTINYYDPNLWYWIKVFLLSVAIVSLAFIFTHYSDQIVDYLTIAYTNIKDWIVNYFKGNGGPYGTNLPPQNGNRVRFADDSLPENTPVTDTPNPEVAPTPPAQIMSRGLSRSDTFNPQWNADDIPLLEDPNVPEAGIPLPDSQHPTPVTSPRISPTSSTSSDSTVQYFEDPTPGPSNTPNFEYNSNEPLHIKMLINKIKRLLKD